MCFCVDDRYYCYSALPFGLSLSPLVFTKFMWVVATFVCAPKFPSGSYFCSVHLPLKHVRRGTRMLIYLDDLLFLMPGNAWAPLHAKFILELLGAFGL